MEALAHPSPDTEDDAASCPMVKSQLLPALRSFCSALKGMYDDYFYNDIESNSFLVCEEVCSEENLFDDKETIVTGVELDDIRDLATKSDVVDKLENRIKCWCKKLSDILKESEQIRKENHSSGEALNVRCGNSKRYV